MKYFGIFLIKLYQFLISPLFAPSCRFYPSCSEYALQAINKYGFFSGIWIGIKRISKCQPFHPGGIDPLN